MRRSIVVVATAALAAAACGEKGAQPAPKPQGPDPTEELKIMTGAVVPQMKETVPDELKGKLEFQAVLDEKERVVQLIPQGWQKADVPGTYKPPADADLGFMTEIRVDSSCGDGECKPRDDWSSVANRVEFAPLTGNRDFKIEKDDQLGEGGRLIIARSPDRVVIAAAQWKKGASQYYFCRATLDLEVADAAPVFERACRSFKVLVW